MSYPMHDVSNHLLQGSHLLVISNHLYHTIMSYPIHIFEIPWLGIRKSLSKHSHPSIKCFWCLKSKDHSHNHDMNQTD